MADSIAEAIQSYGNAMDPNKQQGTSAGQDQTVPYVDKRHLKIALEMRQRQPALFCMLIQCSDAPTIVKLGGITSDHVVSAYDLLVRNQSRPLPMENATEVVRRVAAAGGDGWAPSAAPH